jgi:DNA-binding sugar fermentation-stimulating protein
VTLGVALSAFAAHGVEVLAYACEITTEAVRMAAPVPWAR